MPKVSVIVPVYNVSLYIEKCAISLFSQTLDDIEFIFVNDCSTDNSIDIIKRVLGRFPDRVSQTRIVDMSTNNGQAGVRHLGLRLSTGDYVIHCDSDDWVDENLYETLYNKALNEESDIVVCDFKYEYQEGAIAHLVEDLPNTCSEVVKNFYKRPIAMFCWNKLVKRSLFVDNDVWPWEGLNMWEDNGLMTRIFYFGGRLSQIRNTYYHYNRANNNAMTADYGVRQVQQMISIATNLTCFFIDHNSYEEYKKTIFAFQFLAKINLITDELKNIKIYREIFPECNAIIPEINPNAFSRKGKIRFWFVKHHLEWFFVLLFKIRNLCLKFYS